MRRSTFSLALGLLLAIVWLGLQIGSPRAAEDSKSAVQKWEYRTASGDAPGLNKLGSEGWEMCGVVKDPRDSFFTVYLKRPLQ